MSENDRREFGPPEDIAMLPWYLGHYSHAFVALHPFVSVDGLDPATCEYGTMVLPGGERPQDMGLLEWMDEETECRRAGKELASQSVDEIVKRFGHPVGWRLVCNQAGFADHCALDRALRTHIMGLRDELEDRAGAERLVEFGRRNRLFLPTEGSFQPIMQNSLVDLFESADLRHIVAGDEFGDDDRLISTAMLRTESPWHSEDVVPTYGARRMFAQDHSLLAWVHWDSFYTVIFATEERLASIRPSDLFEGFWCSAETKIYWLQQPCLALAQ